VQAEGFAVSMQDEAIDHLVRVVGPDLAKLKTEIAKLAAATDGEVTAHDVEVMVGVNHGETVTDWVASVLERQTARAVALLEVVLSQAGVSGVRLVSTLGTALVGVRYARALADRGENRRRTEKKVFDLIRSARTWNVGNWKVEAARWADAAAKWTGPELDRAIRAAFEADRSLKSTTITGESGVLTQMILEFGTAMEEK
jgi:DNA polymerase III delta subunit